MKVWQLLDSPEKWTQREYARASDGRAIFAESPYACRWCILGAIQKCYGTGEEALQAREKIDVYNITKGKHWLISIWNDAPATTWQEIYDTCKELDV